MNDKELLKLAAKAADITLSHWDRERKTFSPVIGVAGPWWNPLTDDGDALRLAVTCKIDIEFDYIDFEKAIAWYCLDDKHSGLWSKVDESVYTGDTFAATRRAIVRAAAEIGKSL
jgi:hypothetical protein